MKKGSRVKCQEDYEWAENKIEGGAGINNFEQNRKDLNMLIFLIYPPSELWNLEEKRKSSVQSACLALTERLTWDSDLEVFMVEQGQCGVTELWLLPLPAVLLGEVRWTVL